MGRFDSYPRTSEDVQELVRSAEVARIECRGTSSRWRVWSQIPKVEEAALVGEYANLRLLRGIVDFSAADQVVTVEAGTRVFELQNALKKEGQCLPFGGFDRGSIGGAIAMNLPHGLEGRFGSWRDWILGLKVVLADGTLTKCGSHAVKNVAGYDVQKLLVGSRGTLGIIVEATLRTFPLVAIPSEPNGTGSAGGFFSVIQRVRRSDYAEAVSRTRRLQSGDPETGTLWYTLAGTARGPTEQPVRYAGDWILQAHQGEKNLQITDPTQIRLMKRTKEIFDPTHKLNPGEMGIF